MRNSSTSWRKKMWKHAGRRWVKEGGKMLVKSCKNKWRYVWKHVTQCDNNIWLRLRKIYENMQNKWWHMLKHVKTYIWVFLFDWCCCWAGPLTALCMECKIWDEISVSVLLSWETQKYFPCFSVFCSLGPKQLVELKTMRKGQYLRSFP